METIEITFDPERYRKAFKKYFDYCKKQQVKRFPSEWIIVFSFVLVVIGLVMDSTTLVYFALLVAAISIIYLIYFHYKYEAAFNNYIKAAEQHYLESESTFTFGFDSNGLSYTSPNTNQQIKWDIIEKYEVNDGDIYLLYKNGSLFDIISESVLGKEKYSKFMEVLIEKYS